MDSAAFLHLLRQQRAIAVIRATHPDLGFSMAKAAAAGGLRLIEITWNSGHPAQLISQLRDQLPHCHIGVGTVLSIPDLREAQAAGAEFAFAPYTQTAMVHWAQEQQLPMVPGALTPNEIAAAWQAGATAVKVFPISALGGASYIRSLQEPLGHIPLVPTGGVTVENAATMLQAGATAVGLSTGLFSKGAIAQANWPAITEAARQLVATCQPFYAEVAYGPSPQRELRWGASASVADC